MPIHEIDATTGETPEPTPAMGISTAPEDRGEEEAAPSMDEAMAKLEAELAAMKAAAAAKAAAPAPVEAPTKTAAEIDAEQIAATLAKANAAAAAEQATATKAAEKVAAKVQEANEREAAMDAAKANGAAQAAAGKPAGRQVTKAKPAEVTSVEAVDDELMALFEADAGEGLDFTAEDLAIPRLYLLQDMSPQVKERSPDYVEGARPGMWYNTVTGQIMPAAVLVPIKFQRRYVAWRPRLDNGGGGGLVRPDVPYEEFMGYEETGISVRSYRDDKGLVEVVNTPELIALLLPEAGSNYGAMPVAISFPKTKAKVVARMNTIITMQKGRGRDGKEFDMPIYSNVFRLSQKVEGEGQQSYFVPVEEHLGRVTIGDYYGRAKRLYQQFKTSPVHVADVGASEQ